MRKILISLVTAVAIVAAPAVTAQALWSSGYNIQSISKVSIDMSWTDGSN